MKMLWAVKLSSLTGLAITVNPEILAITDSNFWLRAGVAVATHRRQKKWHCLRPWRHT